MTNGETGGFLERLRNSPRTVSAIIVILIVVGAIFAFSDRGGQPSASPTPTAAGTESPEASPAPAGGEAEGVKGEATQTPSPVPLPEAQETDTAYVEVASAGEGTTHLARRAMLRYLEANKPDYEVTAEHKVWTEDYLKDRLGRDPLGIGEQKTVEKNLVREAIEKANGLTDAQRNSLQRFSQQVAAYR